MHYHSGHLGNLGNEHTLQRKPVTCQKPRSLRYAGMRPSEWMMLDSKAHAAFVTGRFNEAYGYYKRLLENYPERFDFCELLFRCGLAASRDGQSQVALSYFRRCFKMNPSPALLESIEKISQV